MGTTFILLTSARCFLPKLEEHIAVAGIIIVHYMFLCVLRTLNVQHPDYATTHIIDLRSWCPDFEVFNGNILNLFLLLCALLNISLLQMYSLLLHMISISLDILYIRIFL